MGAYKNHRKIRVLVNNSFGVEYGISLPKQLVEEVQKTVDINKTFFQVFLTNNNVIVLKSGIEPPKLHYIKEVDRKDGERYG